MFWPLAVSLCQDDTEKLPFIVIKVRDFYV